jgi:hypothetical protein
MLIIGQQGLFTLQPQLIDDPFFFWAVGLAGGQSLDRNSRIRNVAMPLFE